MGSNRRPFRFGIQFSETRSMGTEARTEWMETARKAEALGYDVLVMPDHFGGQLAIGPALAVVAEATSTLRIGTLVYQNDLRHPALVAMEVATLDVLSNGRFELGIGAGGSFMPDYEWTGIPFDPASTRVSRLEESVQVLKGLFADEPLTVAGHHYTITGLEAAKTIQRPHPPILIGGGGPRMLSSAAREADIVSIFPTMVPSGGRFKEDEGTTGAIAHKIDLIRQTAGDRFAELELNILVQAVIITDDREAEIERWSAERNTPVDHWLDSPHILVGTVEQIGDELQAHREQLGISYFVVFGEDIDTFAPVIAQLAGR